MAPSKMNLMSSIGVMLGLAVGGVSGFAPSGYTTTGVGKASHQKDNLLTSCGPGCPCCRQRVSSLDLQARPKNGGCGVSAAVPSSRSKTALSAHKPDCHCTGCDAACCGGSSSVAGGCSCPDCRISGGSTCACPSCAGGMSATTCACPACITTGASCDACPNCQ